jgi:phosphatidylinositol alpha-1,6-mannosyltransferase
MASGITALGLAVAGARDALADGELGVAVAEAEFDSALHRTLEESKQGGQGLATAVRKRFGREQFASGVEWALHRLLPVT